MQQAASGGEQLLQEYSYALMDAFEEVFDVTLHLVIGEPGSLGIVPGSQEMSRGAAHGAGCAV